MYTRRQKVVTLVILLLVFAGAGIVYRMYRRGQLGISADVFSTGRAPTIVLTDQAGIQGTKDNPAEFDQTTAKPDGTIQLAPAA